MALQQALLPLALPPLDIPRGCPVPPTWPPPAGWWEAIVVAFSGGIDSQAMLLDAVRTYPKDRILAVFNDTGDDHDGGNRLVDWAGTLAFVRQECEALGLPLVVTSGPADLLEYTEHRGMWADSKNRYCTSDLKRSPTDKVLRNLIIDLAEYRQRWSSPAVRLCTDRTKTRPTDRALRHLDAKRILLLTGELAEESPARAKKPEWQLRAGALAPTKGRLVVWHRPQLHWSKEDEILFIWSQGRDIAPTYYAGWDRLSCRFCFFLTFERQVLSFVGYPETAAQFTDTEERIGHRVSLNYKFDGHSGYRAIWEFTYGPWCGIPAVAPAPLPRALTVVERLRGQARAILDGLAQGERRQFKRCGGCA